MCHGACQFDVPHAFAAHLGEGDFHPTFFADHATVLESLVLTTQAFIVFDRAEYPRAEQAVSLRFERAVIDRLRLFDFTE